MVLVWLTWTLLLLTDSDPLQQCLGVVLLYVTVALLVTQLAGFHRAGLDRLARDRDGVPLVGEVAGGISSAPCRTSQHSS